MMRPLIGRFAYQACATVLVVALATELSGYPAGDGKTVSAAGTNAAPVADATSLYSLTVNSQDGKPVDLHQYMGHVALVVNTGTKSAYAEQFVLLEKIYQTYKDKGFVVLDFPSNDFGHLEPGAPQEIAARYATFKLTFPIFETVEVRGENQSPVYRCLTAGHSTPLWAFHKYLIDKTGKVIAEFSSQTKPDSKEVVAAIDDALK